MKNILRYSHFIKESESFSQELNDLPWEGEMKECINRINSLEGKLINLFHDGKETFRFNIKVYDSPDVERLTEITGRSEEFIYNEFHEYKGDRVESFSDSLDVYPWIIDVWQEGRSGGWLCVKSDNSLEDLEDEIKSSTIDYISMKEEYEFPLSQEELEEIDFYLNSNKLLYDFNLADKPKIITELYETFNKSLELLEQIESLLNAIYKGYLEIKDNIEESKKNLVQDFESYFLENYGENDKEI